MRKIVKIVLAVALVFVTVVSITSYITMKGERKAERVKNEITRKVASAKLIGAEPEVVLSFLDQENIPHGDYSRVYPIDPSLNRTISASLPWVARTWRLPQGPYGVTITMVFRFDENDRCERYDIDMIPQI